MAQVGTHINSDRVAVKGNQCPSPSLTNLAQGGIEGKQALK